MREYVLHQSEHRPGTSGMSAYWYWLRNWQSRLAFARLAKLSDYQLKDIGLTRADAVRLSSLPLSMDPIWEADRLRLVNSRRVDQAGLGEAR